MASIDLNTVAPTSSKLSSSTSSTLSASGEGVNAATSYLLGDGRISSLSSVAPPNEPTEGTSGEAGEGGGLRAGEMNAEEQAESERLAHKGQVGRMIRTGVLQVASILVTELPGVKTLAEMYEYINPLVPIAVSAAEDQQGMSGEVWTDVAMFKNFRIQLLAIAREGLQKNQVDLGNTILGQVGTDLSTGRPAEGPLAPGEITYTATSSAVAGNESDVGVMLLKNQSGRKGPARGCSVIDFHSSARQPWKNTLPSNMRIMLADDNGVGYKQALTYVVRITLQAINVNAAPFLSERIDGMAFYVGIDEVTGEYNKQSIGNATKAQFKCFAKPDPRENTIKLTIVSGTIDMPITSNELSILTIHLYDDIKRDLLVEQDIYAVTSVVPYGGLGSGWIELAIGPHSVRTGDRVVLRGITTVEDAHILDDWNDFRARVLTATSILVFISRFDVLTYVLREARVIDLNKVITVTLGFENEY
jgi:hypothetical protein